MHHGFTVLHYDHGEGTFDPEARLNYTGGHTSLGYGADWQAPTAAADDSSANAAASGGDVGAGRDKAESSDRPCSRPNWLIGSASFYDHRLEVWSVVAKGDARSVDAATTAAGLHDSSPVETPPCDAKPRVRFDVGLNVVSEIPRRGSDFLSAGWSFTAH